MSRDSNGNYTLPAGNPVQTDTVIESNWANSTMGDLRNEMTNSLDRQGRGGMLAPLKGVDGDSTTPAFAFTNEFNTGFYRNDAGDIRLSLQGTDALIINELDDVGAPLIVKLYGGDFEVRKGTYRLNDGAFTINGGDTTFVSGTYLFDGVGLELDGTDLYIGDKDTGDKVATFGNITALDVSYDNTSSGLPATDVQTALDVLSVGAQTYKSIPQTGGGDLVAGVMNEILDGNTYDIPLANSVPANTQLGISLPSTAAAFKPLVQRKSTDVITYKGGSDTDMQFKTPATIWITSDGVGTWRY